MSCLYLSDHSHVAHSARMLSALEIVGVSALAIFAGLVLRELSSFLYTTYIGHALGKTIALKNIGQWAGEFPSLCNSIF